MEALYSTTLSIPLIQISLLLLISTLAVMFGRMKLALVINYCFTLYWCYILNPDVIQGNSQNITSNFIYLYFGFGFIILMLALLGFVGHRD
jgi:hypothetical protein